MSAWQVWEDPGHRRDMIYISDLMDEASLVEAATVSLENSDVNNKATASVEESIALELVYHIGPYDGVLCISN